MENENKLDLDRIESQLKTLSNNLNIINSQILTAFRERYQIYSKIRALTIEKLSKTGDIVNLPTIEVSDDEQPE